MKSKFASICTSLFVSGFASCLLPTMSTAADAPKDTPESVYNKYHHAMITAKSCEDVMPFLVQKTIKQMNDTPAQDRTMMFSLMQETCPKDVHITASKIEGEHAHLTLIVGDGKPIIRDNPIIGKTKDDTKGEVNLVVENGAWKIEKESWNTKSVSADSAAPPSDMPQVK